MNLDRFQPPTASDDMATCVCCGERFHYERLNDVGLCEDCRDEDEDMSEQETEAAELIAESAVGVAERLKAENRKLRSGLERLRDGDFPGTPINPGSSAMMLIEETLRIDE